MLDVMLNVYEDAGQAFRMQHKVVEKHPDTVVFSFRPKPDEPW